MLDNSHNYDYNRDKNIFSINRLIMFNLINGGKTVMVKKTKKCISVALALIMMQCRLTKTHISELSDK